MGDQPNSRRSFIFGHSLRKDDPWPKFISRLKRNCDGHVSLIDRPGGGPSASLVAAHESDVVHALALCREYGVCMALDGVALPHEDRQRSLLVVHVDLLNQVSEIAPGLWRVSPGCTLQDLQSAGLEISAWPCSSDRGLLNMAQWISLVQLPSRIGVTQACGVHAVECMYSDGVIEVLGSFGVADSQPLRSLTAQRTVPKLFQLCMNTKLQQLLAIAGQGVWPLRYRLDALMGSDGMTVNLGHIFLGHGASLGWVMAAYLEETRIKAFAEHLQQACQDEEKVPYQVRRLGEVVDHAVKRVMDPDNVYMSYPVQTG